MSILDEIYEVMYSEKRPEVAEYPELEKRSQDSWEKAEAILGFELADKVWTDLSMLDIVESHHDFREGFRLGVRLMLEARTPGDPACITVGTPDNILK